MQLQLDNLGKVSVTVEQGYWDINKDYDKLVIVEKQGIFGTYISRKPVPAGTVLTDRKYWIPFSSLKEEIIIDYNKFIEKYRDELDNHQEHLEELDESVNNLLSLKQIAEQILEDNEVIIRNNNQIINDANTAINNANITLEKANKALSDNTKLANKVDSFIENISKEDIGLSNVTNDTQVKRSEMAAPNGVATLNSSGQIPSNQLPSYVDDVLEYDTFSSFPKPGERGKIYVDLDNEIIYRWSGSQYIEISKSFEIGADPGMAYPTEKGQQLDEDLNNHIENTTVHITSAERTKWNNKQDSIYDLASIRSGAAAGATAIQNETDPTVPSWAKQANKPSYTKTEIGLGNVTNDAQVKRSELGVANGVAQLDNTGKLKSVQLPDFNKIYWYDFKDDFPEVGEQDSLYGDRNENKLYNFDNPDYVLINDNNVKFYDFYIPDDATDEDVLYVVKRGKGFFKYVDGTLLPVVEDQVHNYTNKNSFPITGAQGHLYIDETKHKLYHYYNSYNLLNDSSIVELDEPNDIINYDYNIIGIDKNTKFLYRKISPGIPQKIGLTIGTTSNTAYDGASGQQLREEVDIINKKNCGFLDFNYNPYILDGGNSIYINFNVYNKTNIAVKYKYVISYTQEVVSTGGIKIGRITVNPNSIQTVNEVVNNAIGLSGFRRISIVLFEDNSNSRIDSISTELKYLVKNVTVTDINNCFTNFTNSNYYETSKIYTTNPTLIKDFKHIDEALKYNIDIKNINIIKDEKGIINYSYLKNRLKFNIDYVTNQRVLYFEKSNDNCSWEADVEFTVFGNYYDLANIKLDDIPETGKKTYTLHFKAVGMEDIQVSFDEQLAHEDDGETLTLHYENNTEIGPLVKVLPLNQTKIPVNEDGYYRDFICSTTKPELISINNEHGEYFVNKGFGDGDFSVNINIPGVINKTVTRNVVCYDHRPICFIIDNRNGISDPNDIISSNYRKISDINLNNPYNSLIEISDCAKNSDEYNNILTFIKNNTHRYLGEYNNSNKMMQLIQLDDSNSNLDIAGNDVTEKITSYDYDVFVKLPKDIYYRSSKFYYYDEEDNCYYDSYNMSLIEISYYIPENDTNNWNKFDCKTLIGAYEGVINNETLYSISDTIPDNKTTFENFIGAAQLKGDNFLIETYEIRVILALIFFGYYGTVNFQEICGSGTNNNVNNIYYPKKTGITNILGMTDTNSITGNGTASSSEIIAGYGPNMASVNFLGIENICGDIVEHIGDIRIMKYNNTSTIRDEEKYIKDYLLTHDNIVVIDINNVKTIKTSSSYFPANDNSYIYIAIKNLDGTIKYCIQTKNISNDLYIRELNIGDNFTLFPRSSTSYGTDSTYITDSSRIEGNKNTMYCSGISNLLNGGIVYMYSDSNNTTNTTFKGARLVYIGNSEIIN